MAFAQDELNPWDQAMRNVRDVLYDLNVTPIETGTKYLVEDNSYKTESHNPQYRQSTPSAYMQMNNIN